MPTQSLATSHPENGNNTKSGLATPVMRAKKTALTYIFFQPQLREKFDGKAVINFRNLANLAISKQVNIFALARQARRDDS